jgi:outer membrane protein assembly factor BamB
MPRKASMLLTCLALVTAGSVGAHAETPAACGTARPGGDWPLYGNDLSNTRTQNQTSIDPVRAQALTPGFIFDVAKHEGSGNINSTPTVAGGCVYVGTDGGDVFALNADSGDVVWHRNYFVASTRLGGVITGAIAIDNGTAFVAVSDAGHPFLAALDAASGQERWRAVVDDRPGSFTNASPVPFDGKVFLGFSGDEYVPDARGGYAIIDQRDGTVLTHTYTIPQDDYARDYYGGSIWSSAVVDQVNDYLYVGSGNPASHDKEHQATNSILKIDVGARPTFGAIVDSYKGTVEQYYPGLNHQPACEAQPDITYGDAWSATCVQFDLDFGSSPNLYTDARGNVMVTELQKSGVLHGVFTDHMSAAWTTVLGTPCFVCNAASTATHGDTVFAVATQPGQLVAVDRISGAYRWVQPLADAVHYESVSVANGVVYVPDFFGNLNAFDEATGVPLLKHQVGLDVGAAVLGTTSAGAAIARDTVYLPAAGFVVAYR